MNAVLSTNTLTEVIQIDAECRNALAYYGPFYFDARRVRERWKNGVVIHGPVISSTVPSFVGSEQIRQFQFTREWIVFEFDWVSGE